MEDELVNPPVGSVKASEYPEHYDWKKPWPVLALATKGFSADENRLSWLLLGVTALVLLIATSDVAGLLLARSEHEEKERAIRSSLGATRWSLLRFQLVRGLLLATLGSVAGLFASSWASKLLFASAPEGLPLPVGIASSVLGFRVIAFVLGISCVAGVGFSILPELRRRASELSESLKQQVSGLHAGSSRASRLQVALVFSQIAASILLLVGAGLLIQTTRNIARIDLGFDTDHVLSATLDFSRQGYTKAQAAATIRPLLEKVKSLPGVSSAALVAGSPVTWRPSSMKSKPPVCNNLGMTIVSPGYFQTLQIPFLRGRDFTSADEKNSPGVLILNQAAANLCWKDQDPIGKSVPGIATVGRPFEIIGIVANIRVDEDDRNPRPHMYTAISQFFDAFPWQLQASILARTNLPPHSMVAALNSGVRSLDPNLSLYDVQTPRELLARSFDRQTFFSRILSVFGLLAFVLAIAGLYGLLAYVTAKRSREFGIRMALGALPGQIFRLVLQQGGVVTAAGVIAGLVAVAGASRFLQSVLFGVSATDGRVFLAVGGFFLVTGLLACFLPARRATRVDPVIALRDE
jgi:predicted permease